jgi:hypothetical protein
VTFDPAKQPGGIDRHRSLEDRSGGRTAKTSISIEDVSVDIDTTQDIVATGKSIAMHVVHKVMHAGGRRDATVCRAGCRRLLNALTSR